MTKAVLKTWYDPKPDEIADRHGAFLQQLGQPTCLFIPGKDTSKIRAITTLLHGNEPSGLIAVHQWLKSHYELPEANILIIIASVKTALTEPLYTYRHLPDERDLNRCFNPPYEDKQGQVAEAILNCLAEYQPEALLDIHNTSGDGPDFAVTINDSKPHQWLSSLFTGLMIKTDLRLGAIMEVVDNLYPTVTIECGGAKTGQSHRTAFQGLQRYLHTPELFAANTFNQIQVLYNPVRLELDDNINLDFCDQPVSGKDLTLRKDIERFNFGVVDDSVHLGWLNNGGDRLLKMSDLTGNDIFHDYFDIKDNTIYPSFPIQLFMITTNPVIAVDDCLFYAVKARH
ncbi:M14 family metallopeptidase [Spartinivicinus ruber]|uniref:succinylglutamate desuccinylase/aspartoacylase domain-containing protein n=1 Tax=Spartinivicinus ruber TaxID=2683272 RepID=UPI0013D2CB83|nr:succinylglutamate desuccinylase/aspartoacylase family protein [Spartinivicinus ruber]